MPVLMLVPQCFDYCCFLKCFEMFDSSNFVIFQDCIYFFIYNIFHFLSTYPFYSWFWNNVLVIIYIKSVFSSLWRCPVILFFGLMLNIKAPLAGTDWGKAPEQKPSVKVAVLPSSSKFLLKPDLVSLHCFFKLFRPSGQLLYLW